MGSIRALHGWRRSYFEFTDGHGHLDADAPILSTHSPLLQRGRSRSRGGSSSRNRKHRNKWGGMCDAIERCSSNGNGDDPTGMIGPPDAGSTDPPVPPGEDVSSQDPQAPGLSTAANDGSQESTRNEGSDASNTTVNNQATTDTSLAGGQAPTMGPPYTPMPPTTPPSALPAASDNPSPEGSPQTALANSRGTNTGAIIGGVIGGVAFLLLLALLTFLFLRRRKRKRTPASAEFRDRYIPRSTPPFLSQSRAPLATQTSREDLYLGDNETSEPDPPPPFTQGNFNDPLFEKIYETQKAHVEYGLAR